MDRKKVGIAIVGLGAIMLIVIIWLLFFHNFNPAAPATTTTTTTNTVLEPAKVVNSVNDAHSVISAPKKKTATEASEDDLKRLAMLFAERFGSYSNQSTFQNMLDLKLFMTPKMSDWVNSYVSKQIEDKKDSTVYYGLTTKAVSASVENFSEKASELKVEVSTQRREATGTTNNASSYGQKIMITFIKDGNTWKVNEARWEDEKLK